MGCSAELNASKANKTAKTGLLYLLLLKYARANVQPKCLINEQNERDYEHTT